MSAMGISWVGLTFASWGEAAFVVSMTLPLLFFLACALYLWRLLLNALPSRSRVVTLPRPEPASLSTTRLPLSPEATFADGGHSPHFVILIPAHNEEMLLGVALDTLRTLEYPASRYEVVVIADNCTDRTAEIARRSGALVMERFDSTRIGKGFALEDMLTWLLAEPKTQNTDDGVDMAGTDTATGNSPASIGGAETVLTSGSEDAKTDAAWLRARQFNAVVVLDADTFVSPNLLTVFAARLQQGDSVIQARYDVFNTDDSWRTRLMSCALALAHVVKPLGRERLRLSDGLKGNGMCFARDVVERVPWSGDSITEDIEYALRLCRAGYRIAFVPEACVWAQMPTSGAQAVSQRKRWEGGRYRLLFTVAPGLLRESLHTGNRLLRDRAVELIVPPFAEMFALPVLLGSLCLLTALLLHWLVAGLLTVFWALILLLQAGYLFGGMWAAKMPGRVALSLLCAPFYILWKLGVYVVMAVGRSAGGWKRTERHELSK